MHKRSTPMPRASRRPELRRYLGRFPGELPAVKDARDWLARRLNLTRVPTSTAHDALLILSELVTNVLLHSPAGARGRTFFVSVFISENRLRISVHGDGDTSVPVLRPAHADPEAEHGRGLFLVDALAATWGTEHTRRGQAVFFTLTWDQREHISSSHHSTRRPPVIPKPRTPLRHSGGW